ncbi:hypothetical protein UlMin_004748 [Ulmus minor]
MKEGRDSVIMCAYNRVNRVPNLEPIRLSVLFSQVESTVLSYVSCSISLILNLSIVEEVLILNPNLIFVVLLGMAQALQRYLNRIAKTADTSSPEGLSYILTETLLSLLRHPDYCISGYSSIAWRKGEKRFNQLSIEEQGKFDEETLVNANNIKRKSTCSVKASGFSNEYIVLFVINGNKELKEALQKLGSIPSSKILAIEVLWTPQHLQIV